MPRMDRIFIVVPSASTASPVKGAIALANAWSRLRPVCLVSLKQPDGGFELLAENVERISLASAGSWPWRTRALRRLIGGAGHRTRVASVSFCLSADFSNVYCRDLAVTASSIRGNLPAGYATLYGPRLGPWIARRQLRVVRHLNHVVSMTHSMAAQVASFIGRPSPVIGNFLDEIRLEPFRAMGAPTGAFRFVFVGRLMPGKRPLAMVAAMRELQRGGADAELQIFGDGPLEAEVRAACASLPRPDAVRLRGHVAVPYAEIAAADALVLPSEAEGLSRAALEALHLGVPCVLRDADGNGELIREGANGALFKHDTELASAMLRTAEWGRRANPLRATLLPNAYRQEVAATEFLELIESGKSPE
jgi:glycosyltransferase involved in cell wall biosynthesis